MKPSQTAQALRRIASKIQSSKNPDRTLVARDLKKILAAVINSNSISTKVYIWNKVMDMVAEFEVMVPTNLSPIQTLQLVQDSIDQQDPQEDTGAYNLKVYQMGPVWVGKLGDDLNTTVYFSLTDSDAAKELAEEECSKRRF